MAFPAIALGVPVAAGALGFGAGWWTSDGMERLTKFVLVGAAGFLILKHYKVI